MPRITDTELAEITVAGLMDEWERKYSRNEAISMMVHDGPPCDVDVWVVHSRKI